MNDVKLQGKDLALTGALVVFATCGAALSAPEQKGAELLWSYPEMTHEAAGNGIAVDHPKVFDNRSLVLMVEQLDAVLARLNFVDQAKLGQGVGLLQGIRQTESSMALSLSTVPTPATELKEKRDSATGLLVPDERKTTVAAFTPTPPTLPAPGLPSVSQSNYGIAAQDILSEEINLTYQMVNLRMLLERSISDRIHKAGGAGGPRAQAVLGFQVSIDPRTEHKNSAAVVEIDLTPVTAPAGAGAPAAGVAPPEAGDLRGAAAANAPSLVAMMPQAKTYNVAALSRKENAFSAAAVVKIVSVGVSARHAAQTYYLYRDTDTVAFQRPVKDRKKLVFGWEFRPVLNRTAVEPGLRQLFAVIALDELGALAPGAPDDFQINVKVRTYWCDFNKKHAVISSAPRNTQEYQITPFGVPRSQVIQSSLGPRVEKVELKRIDEENVLIDVWGDNFYNGTVAVIGGQTLDSTNRSLLIKSDQLLQIVAKTHLLASGNVFLSGRYGLSTALIDKAALASAATTPDKFILSAQYDPLAIKRKNELELTLSTAAGQRPPDLKGKAVLITIGQEAFVREATEWYSSNNSLKSVVPVSADVIRPGSVVFASIPFLGGEYRTSALLYEPATAERTVVVHEGDTHHLWGIMGTGFDDTLMQNANTAITADKLYTTQSGLERKDRNLLTIPVPKTAAGQIKNLIVKLGNSLPVILPAPGQTQKPALAGDPAPSAAAGSAPVVEFTGQNLGQVAKISFAGEALVHTVEDAGRKLRIFLTRKVTEKAGRIALTTEFKDGTIAVANVDIK